MHITAKKQTASVIGMVVGLLTLIVLAGCAAQKEAVKDPFFEKWRTMAQEKQGTSPAPRERAYEMPKKTESDSQLKDAALEQPRQKSSLKSLPRGLVALKMRNADVPTILRALARAANQNILIKEGLEGKISVDFNKVPWDEAFLSIIRSQMLTYVWEGDIIRVVTMQDMEDELKMETFREKKRASELLRMKMSPLQTKVFSIDYADAEKLKTSLETLLVKDEKGNPYGSIQVNTHTNSLIVQATDDDMARIVPMIQKIDRPTPQIRIEANIVETTRDTARSLGIQWGGSYTNTINDTLYNVRGTQSDNNYGVNFPIEDITAQTAGGLASLGLTLWKVGGSVLDVQLQALETQGKLNILSSPSITTLDNQIAFTENGERVPYVTINEDGDQEVAFEDAVLRLEITPHVIDGSNLKMKIVINKDEVDTSRDVQGNPFIIKKRTDTMLIVRNGETIVISGLSKTRESKGDKGVPLLMEIPILGWLFKGEDKAMNMEEVLIFITPRILDTGVAKDAS